jgi:hypothetical protein
LHLSVFGDDYQVDSADQLRALLGVRHEGKYGAFWLSESRDGCPALGLFVNEDQACMFYIREEGDPGLHSLGSEPDNFKDEVDFVIDNYQSDRYPRAMVIPTSQAVAAFEEFLCSGAQPSGVRWFEL